MTPNESRWLRRWGWLQSGKRKVPVFIGKWPMQSQWGATYEDRVIVQWPMTRAKWEKTLVHEWIHNWIEDAGVMRMLKRVLGRYVAEDIEEKIVTKLAPVVLKALKAHGFQFRYPGDEQ